MTSQKIVLDVMRAQGTADALDLRAPLSSRAIPCKVDKNVGFFYIS